MCVVEGQVLHFLPTYHSPCFPLHTPFTLVYTKVAPRRSFRSSSRGSRSSMTQAPSLCSRCAGPHALCGMSCVSLASVTTVCYPVLKQRPATPDSSLLPTPEISPSLPSNLATLLPSNLATLLPPLTAAASWGYALGFNWQRSRPP